MLLEFDIVLTGIVRDPYRELKTCRIRAFAVDTLLTFNLSKRDRVKYSGEKDRLALEIKKLQLEIQELDNPSQLLLF